MKHRVRRAPACGVSHPIDAEIGRKIMQRRAQLGMSLTTLAATLRVSPRRVHSFECGLISISASELVAIGAALGLPVFYFFEEKDRVSTRQGASRSPEYSTARAEETEDLIRAYNSIRDPESRHMLAKVVQKLAAGYGEQNESRLPTRKRRPVSSPPDGGWLN